MHCNTWIFNDKNKKEVSFIYFPVLILAGNLRRGFKKKNKIRYYFVFAFSSSSNSLPCGKTKRLNFFFSQVCQGLGREESRGEGGMKL